MSGANLQRAIYAKLTGDAGVMSIAVGVFSDPEQAEDSGSNDPFPYVTIGGDDLDAWDTKTTIGTEATCQVDVWSRKNSSLQAKDLQSAIKSALHYQPLTITDAQHVMTMQTTSGVTDDPDGETKHGIQLFSVRYVET